jgi:hypothetical protein
VPTHFKFTARGHFGTSEETWSFGWKFGRSVDAGGDAGLDDIDESGVTAALVAYIAGPYVSSDAIVDDWRAYVIGTDGRMEGNGPLLHTFAPNTVKGTGAATKYPPQVALAITTIADDRGAAQYGRWYLPSPTVAFIEDMRISAASALLYAQQASAFLKNVSDAIDLPGSVLSASAVNVSAGPPGSPTGTLQQIDHIEVGRVLDTIRNRRKSLVEDRVSDAQIDW